MKRPVFADRFERRGDDECWPWTGYKTDEGYGQFGKRTAQRVAYETFVGPIPQGLTVDHLCRNRACVNPRHLEAVPHRINVSRGQSPSTLGMSRPTCVNGHEWTEATTYRHPITQTRACRICTNSAQRRHTARLRAAS